MVKERDCPSTPGASNTTGKTDGEEVSGRITGSANEKHRVLLQGGRWEVTLRAGVGQRQ